MGIIDRLVRLTLIKMFKEFRYGHRFNSFNERTQRNPYEDFNYYYQKYKDYYQKTNYQEYQYKGNKNQSQDQQKKRSTTGFTSESQKKLAQYYANLEVPFGSSLDIVKKSWKRLLKLYHPDKHQTEEKKKTATVLTQKLNEAYNYIENYWKEKQKYSAG